MDPIIALRCLHNRYISDPGKNGPAPSLAIPPVFSAIFSDSNDVRRVSPRKAPGGKAPPLGAVKPFFLRSQVFLGLVKEKKQHVPGDSSRDLFLSERLVVGCGFCTFGDPLNLQLVRIVQSRTHNSTA